MDLTRGRGLKRIAAPALLIVCLAASASAQDAPKWELFGGYSQYLAGGGLAGEKQLPTNGVQVEFDWVVTSYFRITGQCNAQFADHVVDLAPLPPGGMGTSTARNYLGCSVRRLPTAVSRGSIFLDII